jgi:hypothetical protein
MRLRKKSHESMLYMSSQPALSWRLDPDESLSDWKLTVISAEPKRGGRQVVTLTSQRQRKKKTPLEEAQVIGTKTYFVHRAQLAVGPRKSEYFEGFFRKNSNSLVGREGRNDTNTTTTLHGERGRKSITIELKPSAALWFHTMLDFMYAAPGTKTPISTKNAVALRHLASWFGIKELFNEATVFIKKDLCSERAVDYLKQSSDFRHFKLENVSRDLIAGNFKGIKITSLVSLPPEHFASILESPNLESNGSQWLSSRIASYCRCKKEEITLQNLFSLLSPTLIPIIIAEESLFFIELLSNLDKSLFDSSICSSQSLSIYERCLIQAPKLVRILLNNDKPLLEGRNDLSKTAIRQRDKALIVYNSLPPDIKVRLLEDSFHVEPLKSSDMDSENNLSLTVERKKVRKHIVKIEEDMNDMKEAYERKLGYYHQKLQVKEEEIKKYHDKSIRLSRRDNTARVFQNDVSSAGIKEHPKYDAYTYALRRNSGEGYHASAQVNWGAVE